MIKLHDRAALDLRRAMPLLVLATLVPSRCRAHRLKRTCADGCCGPRRITPVGSGSTWQQGSSRPTRGGGPPGATAQRAVSAKLRGGCREKYVPPLTPQRAVSWRVAEIAPSRMLTRTAMPEPSGRYLVESADSCWSTDAPAPPPLRKAAEPVRLLIHGTL